MSESRKRLATDRCFMLSVYGLCLMVTPLVLIVVIENLLLLIQPDGSNVLVNETAWTLRRFCSVIFENQPFAIGIGIILPTIGAGMVAMAWLLMVRRRYLRWSTDTSSISP